MYLMQILFIYSAAATPASQVAAKQLKIISHRYI
jgi:hypothetical protein